MAKEIKLTRKTNTNLGTILGKMNPFEQDKLPVGELIWKAVTYALDKEANIVRFSRSEIEELIGHKHFDEVIHRDNLVIL